jgi:hypothetical protein
MIRATAVVCTDAVRLRRSDRAARKNHCSRRRHVLIVSLRSGSCEKTVPTLVAGHRADLPQQPELVPVVPSLDDPAVFDSRDHDARHPNSTAGGSDSEPIALMRAFQHHAHGYLVAGSYRVFDCDVQVGKGAPQRANERLELRRSPKIDSRLTDPAIPTAEKSSSMVSSRPFIPDFAEPTIDECLVASDMHCSLAPDSISSAAPLCQTLLYVYSGHVGRFREGPVSLRETARRHKRRNRSDDQAAAGWAKAEISGMPTSPPDCASLRRGFGFGNASPDSARAACPLVRPRLHVACARLARTSQPL